MILRCALVLLSINAYSGSLGASLPVENHSLAYSLHNLTNTCANAFVKSQIQNTFNYCNIKVPPLGEKQFQCLIFYDINKQICGAPGLNIEEDYKAALKKEINVAEYCMNSKDWKLVSDLGGYKSYKTAAEKVLGDTVLCSKACGVDDILSEDTNFFCKYFKWGRELVAEQPVISEGSLLKAADETVDPSASALKVETNNTHITNNTITVGGENNTVAVQSAASIDGIVSGGSGAPSGNVTLPSPILPKFQIKLIEDETEGSIPSNEKPINKAETTPKEITESSDINIAGQQSEGPIEGDQPIESDVKIAQKSEKVDAVISKTPSGQIEDPGTQPDHPPYLINNKNIGDSYEEDDVNDTGDAEIDTEVQNNVQTIISQEYEDDHFFPMFLTVIIFVVAGYVLYHNKNRISKMFFGLIVEGRQVRRRNSRGHAYRRLDTLEQAMSAKTDAPPSKIIY